MKATLHLLLSSACLFYIGCETTHQFSVNSINHPAPIGEYRTFALAAGPEIENPDSLVFMEASRYAHTAMVAEGFREAVSAESADLIVELSFDISKPQTTIQERSEPIYGISRGGYYNRYVKVRGSDGKYYKTVVRSYYPSRRTMLGWGTDIRTETVYEKTLTMRAYSMDKEAGESGQRTEIWAVDVGIRNGSEDLRYYIPRMIAASLDYIDYDSGSLQKIRLVESDPRIQMILAPGV